MKEKYDKIKGTQNHEELMQNMKEQYENVKSPTEQLQELNRMKEIRYQST